MKTSEIKMNFFFKYPTFDALLFYEVIRNLNSDMLVDDIVFCINEFYNHMV